MVQFRKGDRVVIREIANGLDWYWHSLHDDIDLFLQPTIQYSISEDEE